MNTVESQAAYRKRMLAVTKREDSIEARLHGKKRYEYSFVPVNALDTTDAIIDPSILHSFSNELLEERYQNDRLPLIVRERRNEPVYDVALGFHQAVIFQRTNPEHFVEAVAYSEKDLSNDELVDLRLTSAVLGVPSLRFARVATLLSAAFAKTEFAEHESSDGEKMTLDKAFEWTRADVFSTYSHVLDYGFKRQELEDVKTWASDRAAATGLDIHSLLRNIITPASKTAPELIRQVRNAGKGGKRNTGEILPGQVVEVAKRFPGEENYSLQRILLPAFGEAGILPLVVKEIMDELPLEISSQEAVSLILPKIEAKRRPLAQVSLRDRVGEAERVRNKAELQTKIITAYEEMFTDIEEGLLRRVIPQKEMAARLGTTPAIVFNTMHRTEDFSQRVREARKLTEEIALPETKEMAWFIGIMAAHGSIQLGENGKSGRILLFIKNAAVKERCKEVVSNVFDKECSEPVFREGGHPFLSFNTPYASLLGDFKMTEWPTTLREEHNWVLEDNEHLREFLSAYFDVRAQAVRVQENQIIKFPTTHRVVVDMLREVLSRLGIERAFPINDKSKSEGVNGVGIYNIDDLKRLASLIESTDPEKKAILQEIRDRTRKRKSSINKQQIFP